MRAAAVKNFDMPEFYKLEYIREVGACHVRVAEGCDTLLQLSGLLARLARVKRKAAAGALPPM